MINMLLRRCKRLGIIAMFFVFFMCGGKWCEQWNQTWVQDYKRCRDFQAKHVFQFVFFQLSNALMFCSSTLVDFEMNAHKM